MSQASERVWQIVTLSLSLVVSIVLGFVPSWTGLNFSLGSQIQLTIGLFMVFLLLDIVWHLAREKEAQDKAHELWALRSTGDWELSNMRTNFARIVNESFGHKDLYVTHFLNEMQRLGQEIHDAAETQTLRLTELHLLRVNDVLETVLTEHEPTLRYVWPIAPGEQLFGDYTWKMYFDATAKLAAENKLGAIKVILIFEDAEQMLTEPRVRLLLDYYQTHQRQFCRIITRQNYRLATTDSGVPANYLDFGIYGSRLLFRTEQYEPEITGTFTKDQGLIGRYTHFFELMWTSPSLTRSNPSRAENTISLEDLMAFDAQGA